VYNVPYLLAMRDNTQHDICIGKRQGSFTNGEELQLCCTLHHTEATTDIGTSIVSLVTTTVRAYVRNGT
jgi:hypothetical protein